MRSFKTVFAVMSLSVGYVAAQTANVETTLITQVQGSQTLVITEVISVVGTQGATEIVQVKQAANGMTLIESIFLSPTEVKHVEDVDSPTVQGQEVVDCKIPANGLATCVDSLSAVENGQTVVSAATFMSQFPVAPPAPSSSRALVVAPQSPTPAPNSNQTPSPNSPNSPTPAASSSMIAAATSSSSEPIVSPTNLIVNTTSPTATPSLAALGDDSTLPAGSSSTVTPGNSSLASTLPSNATTITSLLNPTVTNSALNTTTENFNGAMINIRPVGAAVAFTFLGIILGVM